jgi:predicted N-acetyltransferase YhbS
MDLVIRKESEHDFRQVEELTREAFWNKHAPGCDEHYLAHVMRNHPDFLPELDFVATLGDKIVGNIMYTKSHLINEKSISIKTITFGPVSVLPEYQKRGIGSTLIQYSMKEAALAGYQVIVIQGHPHDYCKHGFKGSKSMGVSDVEGKFPYSLLVLELEGGGLKNHSWKIDFSPVFNVDEGASADFDTLFPPKQKVYQPSQEEFAIASRAYLV